MQIKDMPADERPQEKLLFNGPSALSNTELLALLLRTGTSDRSVIQLAEDVFEYSAVHIGSLGNADARELMNIDGIGTAKACSVIAAIELSKRLMTGSVREDGECISDSEIAARILMNELVYEKREMFIAMYLNSRHQIESKSVISIGSLDSAPVQPREVFSPAVKRCAAAVIVAHNHPSGDPTPSSNDIFITRQLYEASRIMGIELLDHIVIGRDRYISMKDQGILS